MRFSAIFSTVLLAVAAQEVRRLDSLFSKKYKKRQLIQKKIFNYLFLGIDQS